MVTEHICPEAIYYGTVIIYFRAEVGWFCTDVANSCPVAAYLRTAPAYSYPAAGKYCRGLVYFYTEVGYCCAEVNHAALEPFCFDTEAGRSIIEADRFYTDL
ncbi:hypothetical protein H8B06_09010 [Sphingobacterium sp. DN00404]|uniref:Uncharacterized protein n=1 Tax=Sphingobacterium micropteri TaxID=2763501 RepID=A0ABR7YNS2_9SPHI|nr:hypothetical protein [Sphingobacterium micropteri]MBD1432963.1 hypothetical protein [Sphingobacterium micropteri]